MVLYSDSAVVLRTWKLGEADRIISLYGAQSGKIRAVAKGVRKTHTKFGARLEPISYVNIQCWKGRDLDIITQVDSIELFPKIKGDFERIRKGLAMVEVIEELVGDTDADFEIFRLLVRGLYRLETEDSPFLLSGFLWRLLQVQGLTPELDICIECGASAEFDSFSRSGGGVVCSGHGNSRSISSDALTVLRWMTSGELSRALGLADSSVRIEVEALVVVLVEAMLDRKVNALHLGSY